MRDAEGRQHWMLFETADHHRPDAETEFGARFESMGLCLPETIRTTDELMAMTSRGAQIDLERLTGIEARRVCGDGEDSFTLAVNAARDCLAHSDYGAEDLDMLICCSISKIDGGMSHRFDPPLSLSIKQAIGANQALSFDLSNACAGMLSGVFVLHDFIRRGVVRRGMVVSGEYISHLGLNAANEVKTVLSKQLASLTVGDAGVAAIVEQTPVAEASIQVAAFTTLAEHSRLCTGTPSSKGPGAVMFTKAREIHRAAIGDAPELLREALEASGLSFGDIDWVIPHQTSARAIRKGTKEISEKLGVEPKNVVENVRLYGNTASTTHFVAMNQYLRDGRFAEGDRLMLISFASGLEVGVVIFTMDHLVNRYGR